jgi:hypothetical protein
MRLYFGGRDLLAVRDNKAGHSIFTFHDKIGVKVLKRKLSDPLSHGSDDK